MPLMVVQGWRKRRERRQWALLLCVGLFAVGSLAGCGNPPAGQPPLTVCPTPTSIPGLGPGTGTPAPTPPNGPPLDSSVRISTGICADATDCPLNDPGFPPGIVCYGLGTLINDGKTILTHNHYAPVNVWEDADIIEITNRWGDSKRLTLSDIKVGDRTNPGTLLLDLPPDFNLPSTIPAPLGQHQKGDWAQIVYYDDTNAQIRTLIRETQKTDRYEGQPVAVFLNDGTPPEVINPGDSGGGVFVDNKLIGNNWARIPGKEYWWGKRDPELLVALLPQL